MTRINKMVAIHLSLLLFFHSGIGFAQCVSPCDCEAERAAVDAARTAVVEAQILLKEAKAEFQGHHMYLLH